MSLYDDLGVPPDSSSEDIKKAFKSMAQRHHPDKGGDREKFELAKTAFDVLHDPEKRKRYDNTGKYSTQPEPTIEDMANQELCNLFKGAIEEGFEGDIIKRLTAITEDAIKMARKEIEKCKKLVNRSEKMRARVTRKKGGHNLLHGVAMEIERNLVDKITYLEKRIKVGDKMIELLTDYEDSWVPESGVSFSEIFSSPIPRRDYRWWNADPKS